MKPTYKIRPSLFWTPLSAVALLGMWAMTHSFGAVLLLAAFLPMVMIVKKESKSD